MPDDEKSESRNPKSETNSKSETRDRENAKRRERETRSFRPFIVSWFRDRVFSGGRVLKSAVHNERLAVAGWLAPRFARLGRCTAGDVADLPGVVVGGHADRHVVRVALGRGRKRLVAYLKREHRVRWRDRLASWYNGHGWRSLSEREAGILAALRRLDIPTPRVLAHGETRGRAFLLLEAVRGSIDLRHFLHRMGAAVPDHRRAAATRRLAHILAKLHAAGFVAPDLLSKHLLIDVRDLNWTLVDCARMRRCYYVGQRRAALDLGRLDASLAEDLATPRDRLRCLRCHWRMRGGREFAAFRTLIDAVRRAATAARDRRSVRELRRPPVDESRQQLRWIDGERLCVSASVWRACRGRLPPWLTALARSRVDQPVTETWFWGGRPCVARRWPAVNWLRRTSARITGRRVETSHTRQAGLVFRLQRCGVPCVRVLAFGRRSDGAGFLLTRAPVGTVPLAEWLAGPLAGRARLLRRTGRLIRRLHASGERLHRRIHALGVTATGRPILRAADALRPMPRPSGRWPIRDLAMIIHALRLVPSDANHLVRGYFGGRNPGLETRNAKSEIRHHENTQRGKHETRSFRPFIFSWFRDGVARGHHPRTAIRKPNEAA